MKIRESAEDYLESILVLKKTKGIVRSIDIVRYMDYSKPSVSRAMSLLRENGYITMQKDGWIELTEEGQAIAEKIYERHDLLTKWLVALGVPQEIAAEDACRIEHDISPETFEKLKAFIQKDEK
ncbi:MAG: metal-dependent transcriptional regulator [Oscillospiraceae bacterium]|nr:metal-dependent transcriptional regulator [Oscillospiraceae bacterium]MBQ3242038.1 metal-dependent transcriptional regulator [Oscillospiraceae bacterium]MBQ7083380.1 metal-dependent transcriptional regulator [Oscillospiraceae bacterium]MBR2636331.1 metal-dependent transcriptional regulator [Oscillospiraceae bacterium]